MINANESFRSRATGWWEEYLAEVAPLVLPADSGRTALGQKHLASLSFRWETEKQGQIIAAAEQYGWTPGLLVSCAWALVLSRYARQDSFSMGRLFGERPFPSRCRLHSADFLSLIKNFSDDIEQARNQLSFSVENGPPTGVYQVFFAGSDSSELVQLFESKELGLVFNRDFSCKLYFDANLYLPETIQVLAQRLQLLLANLLTDPGQSPKKVPMVTAAELDRLLVHYNQTQASFPQKTIPQLFQAQALVTPDELALIDGERQLTYRQLDQLANGLALLLQKRGIGLEDPVAICMLRGADMVIAMLAVMKAGGAYVPLDPAYPSERIQFSLEDSGARLLLARASDDRELDFPNLLLIDREWDGFAAETGPALRAEPDAIAYVLFTSGSTGRPKGVAISHRSVAAMVTWAAAEYQPQQIRRVLAATSICFDLSVYELFFTLTHGGSVVIVSNALALNEMDLDVSLINTVPSAISELCRAGRIPRSVTTINLAGEPLRGDLVRQLYALPHVEKVYNLYGPSEDTTYSTGYGIERNLVGEPSIGRPLPNTRAYILDEMGFPTPQGIPGELFLAGSGLARGYSGRPALTAERFLPNPFPGNPAGSRLYRTGDLVRYDAAGVIHYLGRIDHQVKLRGFRIELGEIENALRQHAHISEAIVQVRPIGGEPQLVAWLQTGQALDSSALAQQLARTLPAYMVPGLYASLPAFPLTPNGKINRNALARMNLPESLRVQTLQQQRGPAQQKMVRLWSEVLGVPDIDMHRRFFELGGTSLSAVRLANRVEQVYGQRLSYMSLFRDFTAADLAEKLVLEQEPGAQTRVPPLKAIPRDQPLSPSHAQERLWVLNRINPDSAAYNLAYAFRLSGPLDLARFKSCFDAILARHEILRSRFFEEETLQLKIAPCEPADFQFIDLSHLASVEAEIQTRARMNQLARQPFDLEKGPLMRVYLFKIAEQEQALLLNLDHIIADGWSIEVLMLELAERYRLGDNYREPPVAIQFPDYAMWHREHTNAVSDSQLEWWIKELADAPRALELQTDKPRPPVQTSNGQRVYFQINPQISAQLQEQARVRGITPFMYLMGAYGLLLSRYSGREEVNIGFPAAHRNQPELEEMIGFFVVLLTLRMAPGRSATVLDLLTAVRSKTAEIMEHQDLPFERLVERLSTERDRSRSPLFQASFTLMDTGRPWITSWFTQTDLQLSAFAIDPGGAKFDLALTLYDHGDFYQGELEFNSDLFFQTTMARMMDHYLFLIQQLVQNPEMSLSQISLMDENEKSQMLAQWNGYDPDYQRDRLVHQLFADNCLARPDAIAVENDELTWTYSQLFQEADRVARSLTSARLLLEEPVGIYMEQSPQQIAAILGILLAGGAYVSLDLSYPPQRLEYMIADTGMRFLLVNNHFPARQFAGVSYVNLAEMGELSSQAKPNPSDPTLPAMGQRLCHIIYTSGSTGKPKGVRISHRGVSRLVHDKRYLNLQPGQAMAQVSNTSFDAFTWEIWCALLSGARLCLIDREDYLQPQRLGRKLAEHRVNAMLITAALLTQVAAATPEIFADLDYLYTGGDRMDAVAVAQILEKGRPGLLINAYGPTESTTIATLFPVQEIKPGQENVPIGVPFANTSAFVVDRSGNLVPPSVPGELLIGGDGLAQGYHGLPGLTARSFIPNPFGPAGSRLYCSGDSVMRLASGELVFLGRFDHQVKVRGFRIEPGEVQVILARHPAVEAVAVQAPILGNTRQLVAWYCGQASTSSLRDWLKPQVPDFMIPSCFIQLDRLPVNVNGKLDSAALPLPDFQQEQQLHISPRNETEARLCAIWSEILEVQNPGVTASFFELGGHSLLLGRLANRIQATFHCTLSISQLFARTSIEQMAQLIHSDSNQPPPLAKEISQIPRDQPLNVTPSQEQLWLLKRINPESFAYSLPFAFTFRGPLNIDTLRMSFDSVMARHEILRTRFLVGDVPLMHIDPPQPCPFQIEDLSNMSPSQARLHGRQRIEALTRIPFNLETGPLLRVYLFIVSQTEFLLFVNIDHIIADGWSIEKLMSEVGTHYRAGGRAGLLPLSIQFADYAHWYRNYSASVMDQQMLWWEQYLAETPRVLELVTDRPRPKVQTFNGQTLWFQLEAESSQLIQQQACSLGVTPFMFLMSAYALLLARYSGQDEICLGVPASNRSLPGLDEMIGLFVSILPLRAEPGRFDNFRDFLHHQRENTLQAMDQLDVPMELLVKRLVTQRDNSRSPLFQATFSLLDTGQAWCRSWFDSPDLHLEEFFIEPGLCKFDLSLTMLDLGSQFKGEMEYNRDLFNQESIEGMIERFKALIDLLVAQPYRKLSSITAITDLDRQRILETWNSRSPDFPRNALLHQLFLEQVSRAPQAIALEWEQESWTYTQLEKAAWSICRKVAPLVKQPGEPLGLCLPQGPLQIASILGIIMAGAAFVPLDLNYPATRLQLMIEDSGLETIITRRGLLPDFETLNYSAKSLAPQIHCLDNHDLKEEGPEIPGWQDQADAQRLLYIMYTSGSTGKPKGVRINHRNVSRLVYDRDYISINPGDGIAQVSNTSFDAFTFELWTALLLGARLCLIHKDDYIRPEKLAGKILTHRVQAMFITTALFIQTAQLKPDTFASMNYVLVGGEKADADALRRVLAAGPPRHLINIYGPTESTTFATWFPVEKLDPQTETVPIGKPIANTRAFVVDSKGNLCAPMVPGELLLGGDGLSEGYHARPGQTAEKFIPNPFDGKGSRLYRTGDLVRFLESGDIAFLGRVDYQVKIRGFRIEPGEVETVLMLHPNIQEAVVMTPRIEGEHQLLAWVVAPGQNATDLRAWLAREVPFFMVPQAIVILEKMPINANGKIDRNALPRPQLQTEVSPGQAPRTATEEILAAIWQEVLKLDRVGITDNFFELGGHSLLVTRVATRINRRLNLDFPIRELFVRTTIQQVAELIDSMVTTNQMPPLVPLERNGNLPLSFAQERLWFLDQLYPGQATYNIPAVFRLDGPLDLDLLTRLFGHIVNRHETLRTHFHETGMGPIQVIEPPGPFEMIQTRLDSEALCYEAMFLAAAESFDLAQGPLFKAQVFVFGQDRAFLYVCLHHSIADGISLEVLFQELVSGYSALAAGSDIPWPPLPVQYADYACWQRVWLSGDVLEKQRQFWVDLLSGAPPHIELPTDKIRPKTQTNSGEEYHHPHPIIGKAELDRFANHHQATPFMVMLAAWSVLLARYSNQNDICIGTPIANRCHRWLEGLIGFFANTLVLRIKPDTPDFRTLVAATRQSAMDAYAHQDIPFEQLVNRLQPTRDLSRSPLFQVMFTMLSAEISKMEQGRQLTPDLTITLTDLINNVSRFDLSLGLELRDGQYFAGVEYNTDLFQRATITRFMDHYGILVGQILANPEKPLDRIQMLGEDELQRLLVQWNDLEKPFPQNLCIHQLFERQAQASPQAGALVCLDQEMDYCTLNRLANGLAVQLRQKGIGPEVPVGICLNRSIDMVIAMLAVLKAGGAYVPLDPAYPLERISFSMEDSHAALLITRTCLKIQNPGTAVFCLDTDWDPQELERGPEGPFLPESLAYILFTSGSTGRPKGVAINHISVAAMLSWGALTYSDQERSRVLAATSICFDLSVFEIFLPLTSGGTIFIVENALELINRDLGVTLINTVPSAITELLRARRIPQTVSCINLAGEPLRGDLVRELYQLPHIRSVSNLYGPSEDTTYSTGLRIDPGIRNEPTIGRPLCNTRAYVLNHRLYPVPQGIPGELCLAGYGLARGYSGRPGLTAEKFVPCPFPAGRAGDRMYRTGDLCRYAPDGNLIFMGRLDHQVKLRGFRIELGEIESGLRQHALVREAIALVHPLGNQPQLIAWVESGPSKQASKQELLDLLAQTLPAFMLPGFFVFLEKMPLTPNGKIDRKALLAHHLPSLQGREDEILAPRSELEQVLHQIWAEVLNQEQISIRGDFFAMGGHSLLATRVITRIRDRIGLAPPVRILFEQPTIEKLAAYLEDQQGGEEVRLQKAPEGAVLPLSFSQERLWFLDKLQAGLAVYNMPFAFNLEGRLDVARLEHCLFLLVERQTVLRTRFVQGEKGPVQIVDPQASLYLEFFDMQEVPAGSCDRIITEDAQKPFDLSSGPLLRIKLFRLGAQSHRLYINMHHIISDGWSLSLFLRELVALYASRDLPPLSLTYGDFAWNQRQKAHEDHLNKQLDWWHDYLRDTPGFLELPTDKPRPKVQSFHGASCSFRIGAQQLEQLDQLARDRGATPFMTLLSLWGLLLSRYSNQNQICIGTPTANRDRHQLEHLVGFFVNTLVIKIDIGDGRQSFNQLLARVKEGILDAFAHEDTPFERIVERLQPERETNRSPLFQVIFTLDENPMTRVAVDENLSLTPVEIEFPVAKFDLTLSLVRRQGYLEGQLEYNRDLFHGQTIERQVQHFINGLNAILAEPDRPLTCLNFLDSQEQSFLLSAQRRSPLPEGQTLHQLFEQQLLLAPDRPAFVTARSQLSYDQINRRANQLAFRLIETLSGPEPVVGIYSRRSLELYIAILAVSKAGAAYLCLDPEYPLERIQSMIQSAGVALIIHQKDQLEFETDLPAWPLAQVTAEGSGPDHNPNLPIHWDHASHIIFSSGTTGKPKGSILTHRNILQLLYGFDYVKLEPGFGMGQLANVSFDAFNWELWSVLACGGTGHTISREMLLDVNQFAQRLDRGDIDILLVTTALFNRLVRSDPNMFAKVRYTYFGGEQPDELAVEAVRKGQGMPSYLINSYGPSECSVLAICQPVHLLPFGLDILPVGQVLNNTDAIVVDPVLNLTPTGMIGEMLLGGPGLARGYINQPALTASRFIPDPFGREPGARVYRTGDLMRIERGPDHLPVFTFRGRTDFQIKIRGFRIEPGEIEQNLMAHEQIRTAVVLMTHSDQGDRRLHAYLESKPGQKPDPDQVRRFLEERLPPQMIPAAWFIMDQLPHTPNRKIDRKALLAMTPVEETRKAVVFGNTTQKLVYAVWSELLGVREIGPADNFFDLGGHSLMLLEVHKQLQERIGARIPMVKLFEFPTIGSLANYLETLTSVGQSTVNRPTPENRAAARKGATRPPTPSRQGSRAELRKQAFKRGDEKK